MVPQTLVEELFKAKSHLGHKTNRVHPKAKKYIYTIEQGVSIIDLTLTADLLEKAKQFVSQLGKEQKKLLVVVTKKYASDSAQELCKKHGILYITSKWPAGLLTNFETIQKNINKLKKMEEEKTKGEWNKLVKYEQSVLKRELSKLERLYGGLKSLEKLPDALFVVDTKKEKNAVVEAKKNQIPIIALVDTNVDPSEVNYPIPANDDSFSSIDYIINQIIEAYVKGKK
ncbi:30S ribosomal protein S2 [Candidatus Roizmanbacteria bacterium]|nr:30S ribosomal protein S2 [Candidatus Roizmanbacteria bacterium]